MSPRFLLFSGMVLLALALLAGLGTIGDRGDRLVGGLAITAVLFAGGAWALASGFTGAVSRKQ